MKIKLNYSGIDIDVDFTSKINFLCGDSGTGKTLLMKAISGHCLRSKIKCLRVDSSFVNHSEDDIAMMCSTSEVLLLDNADLYLTNELLDKISKEASLIVISMHRTDKIYNESAKEYIVHYNNMKVNIEEV